MDAERKRFIVLLALLITVLPTVAFANIVWPTLYIVTGIMSWYIILAGLVIEFVFIKTKLKESYVKSAAMAFLMNLTSAVIGLFLIPLSGFITAIAVGPFDVLFNKIPVQNFYGIFLWAISYIVTILCNVLIEGLTLKFVFKKSFKKNFWWLTIANSLSVLLAILILGFMMNGVGM
ncbi:MAG: hypothetical protein IKC07_03785 [Clostridia bacterium]|nr:hypothetical protein [Clostridia bacterium]